MREHTGPAARKALLCIDGGGIRGVMTLKVLERLEQELARLPGRQGTLLADHFDLVAGTSVGAIFASLIALRTPVPRILQIIESNVDKFFVRASFWHVLRYVYDKRALATLIRDAVDVDGQVTRLGSDRLKTHLLLVMRNATTDSPWIIGTSRGAPYNKPGEGCNLDIPLWQLVRASAAAPRFFAPEIVTIGRDRFSFVDGALTGLNNPAFKAFQYATTGPFGLCWPAGEERMSIVSVGTGAARKRGASLDPHGEHIGILAAETPIRIIAAADREQDVLCRTFGRCIVGDPIDSEIGDLISAPTALEKRLFRYYRLNVELTSRRLEALGCGDLDPEQVSRIDAVSQVDGLRRIGVALADELFGRDGRPGRIPPAEIANMCNNRQGGRDAGIAQLETAAG